MGAGGDADLDVVVPWKDGFECATSTNPTTMVRAVRRQALATRFLRVYDDALRPELCAALYDDAVARDKPWGAYVTLADARDVAGAPSDRDAWAREVVRTLFLERAADAVDLERGADDRDDRRGRAERAQRRHHAGDARGWG